MILTLITRNFPGKKFKRHTLKKITLSLFMSICAASCCVNSSNAYSKDFGVWGTTFPILEEDLQEVILKRAQKRLQGGNLKKLQEDQILKVKKSIQAPKSGFSLPRAIRTSVRYYDPTYILGRDLFDEKRRVFAKKGTTITPLKRVSLSSKLLFLNANDKKQRAWLEGFIKENIKPLKIILVEGNPIELEDALRQPVYFDQAGVLIKKLSIRQVPTIVSQEGYKLKIETVGLP